MQAKYQSGDVPGSFVNRCGYNSFFPWNRPGRSMPVMPRDANDEGFNIQGCQASRSATGPGQTGFLQKQLPTNELHGSIPRVPSYNYIRTCPVRSRLNRRGQDLYRGGGEEPLRFSNRWRCLCSLFGTRWPLWRRMPHCFDPAGAGMRPRENAHRLVWVEDAARGFWQS